MSERLGRADASGTTPDGAPAATPGDRWLTPGVVSIGIASLASDASHEQVTSLLPAFLTATLHAGPAALGAIEGASDALVGLSKLVGGPLAAEPRRRARLASGGYLLTTVATAAIGLATAVWQVAILRAVAWAARGVRSPSRDTMLVSLVPPRAYGRASGVERAGDNLGALIGPLVASALVAVIGVRHAMMVSVLPGLVAVASIGIAGREAHRRLTEPGATARLSFSLRELRAAGMGRALVPIACFELGNVATTLLILRASTELEAGNRSATTATSLAILLYALHNAVAATTALAGGSLTDRLGPRTTFTAGAAAYVVAYVLFAVPTGGWVILAAGFALAGAGIGLAETAESTLVAQTLPDRLRGNGYGLLGLVQAMGDLGASLVAGLLWSALSPSVAFGYAAAWMVAASALAGRVSVHGRGRR
ncbi:MAG TPA: MFS transporter [Angustibacter sp.]|nr:MFS transporter [Angustibacter sp.]